MAIYWKKEQDDLVNRWALAIQFNNKKEQLRIYNALQVPLKKMAESIFSRYFNFGENNKNEYVSEAINHLFINLHKFNHDKGTSYAYCQTIIKNFFHNIVEERKIAEGDKKIHIEYYGIDYNGNNEEYLFENLIVYDPNEDTNEDVISERLEAIIAHLTQSKEELIQTINDNAKRSLRLAKQLSTDKRLSDEVIFVQLLIDYFTRYGESKDISGITIADHLTHNLKKHNVIIYPAKLSFLLKKYINLYIKLWAIHHEKKDLNMYNDDLTPQDDNNQGKKNTKHVFLRTKKYL